MGTRAVRSCKARESMVATTKYTLLLVCKGGQNVCMLSNDSSRT